MKIPIALLALAISGVDKTADHTSVDVMAPERVTTTPVGHIYVVRIDGSIVTCTNPEYGTYIRSNERGESSNFFYVAPYTPNGAPQILSSTEKHPLTITCLRVK